MKKQNIIKSTILTVIISAITYSNISFAANTLGRYSYTDKLIACQKLKTQIQQNNYDGTLTSGGLDNFIQNCLNTTFNNSTIVTLGKTTLCQSVVKNVDGCDYSLPASEKNTTITLATTSSTKKGKATFTCGTNNTWNSGSSISGYGCENISSLNTCSSSSSLTSWAESNTSGGSVSCQNYLPAGMVGDTIVLQPKNDAFKGYKKMVCNKEGNNSYWVSETGQSSNCEFTCKNNQDISWNVGGIVYSGTISRNSNSDYGFVEAGKSTVKEYSFVTGSDEYLNDDNFNKNTSFYLCKNYSFKCSNGKWMPKVQDNVCEKILFNDVNKIKYLNVNSYDVYRYEADGGKTIQYKNHVVSWK